MFRLAYFEKMFRSREEIDEHIQTVHVKEMFDHFVKSKKKPVNNGYKCLIILLNQRRNQ